MRATIVVLSSVEEQIAAGDRDIVDPAAVRLSEPPMPLFRGLSYKVPDDVLGMIERLWLQDGRLMAEVDFTAFEAATSLRVVGKEYDLVAVGLSSKPRSYR